MLNISVLYKYIPITVACQNLPKVKVNAGFPFAYFVNWSTVSNEQKRDYYLQTNNHLLQIELPSNSMLCGENVCSDAAHILAINQFYHIVI